MVCASLLCRTKHSLAIHLHRSVQGQMRAPSQTLLHWLKAHDRLLHFCLPARFSAHRTSSRSCLTFFGTGHSIQLPISCSKRCERVCVCSVCAVFTEMPFTMQHIVHHCESLVEPPKHVKMVWLQSGRRGLGSRMSLLMFISVCVLW